MRFFINQPPPPPPVVVVPPVFDFPPIAARTRMLESSYNMLFGKLALKCLFEDNFQEATHFTTRIMLKPTDDPHVDVIATVSGPLDHKPEENIIGNALLCCQGESSEDYGLMGLRYGSEKLSFGVTLLPFASGVISREGYTEARELVTVLVASFYQHMVVQRQVDNRCETNVAGITSYTDFGFELQARCILANMSELLAAASRDRADGKMLFGLGIQGDGLREASYQRADPSSVIMLTANKEHLAEGFVVERPMLKPDMDAGNLDGLPRDLRLLDKIL